VEHEAKGWGPGRNRNQAAKSVERALEDIYIFLIRPVQTFTTAAAATPHLNEATASVAQHAV
jgi:hypothetical protein